MSSIFRWEKSQRLIGDDLVRAQTIVSEFWEASAGQETIISLAGDIIALSVISGMIYVLRLIGGAVVSFSITTGFVSRISFFGGTIVGSAVITGALYVLYHLNAIVNALSVAWGNLSGTAAPPVMTSTNVKRPVYMGGIIRHRNTRRR